MGAEAKGHLEQDYRQTAQTPLPPPPYYLTYAPKYCKKYTPGLVAVTLCRESILVPRCREKGLVPEFFVCLSARLLGHFLQFAFHRLVKMSLLPVFGFKNTFQGIAVHFGADEVSVVELSLLEFRPGKIGLFQVG